MTPDHAIDIKNKTGIVNLVNKLSKDYLIVLVTHEQIDLKNINLISIWVKKENKF